MANGGRKIGWPPGKTTTEVGGTGCFERILWCAIIAPKTQIAPHGVVGRAPLRFGQEHHLGGVPRRGHLVWLVPCKILCRT
ncbi:MAG TPA: hypothetical protein VMX14_01715 [Anaerolineae bacterium]|nr:hypothetical protein [Anaerolineae bacterium]